MTLYTTSDELLPCPFCQESAARMYPPTCTKLTRYNSADRAFPVVRCRCGVEKAGNDWDQSGRSAIEAWNSRASSSTVQQVGAEWMPIETAPNAEQRDMFVVRAFNVSNGFTGGRNYTSDAWCVWRDIHGGFSRWPHPFSPTHWTALPSSPKSEQGDQQ